jgi:biopolymer transport protein ExbD
MRWNRPQDNNGNLNEVNMTPLIDVSLVLVVILLLATPLAFESSFAMRETGPSALAASEQKDVSRVELKILSDTEVRVNRAVVTVTDLETTLRPLLSGGSSQDVTVDCADDVSHGVFVTVLDVAKASGAGDIAVVGR